MTSLLHKEGFGAGEVLPFDSSWHDQGRKDIEKMCASSSAESCYLRYKRIGCALRQCGFMRVCTGV